MSSIETCPEENVREIRGITNIKFHNGDELDRTQIMLKTNILKEEDLITRYKLAFTPKEGNSRTLSDLPQWFIEEIYPMIASDDRFEIIPYKRAKNLNKAYKRISKMFGFESVYLVNSSGTRAIPDQWIVKSREEDIVTHAERVQKFMNWLRSFGWILKQRDCIRFLIPSSVKLNE